MSDYLHGAYGQISAAAQRVAEESQGVIVYIGTAPVHTLALGSGESYKVNKPVLVNNIAEARKFFGYSDDWAKYTLCEAMHAHLERKGIGPIVLINVLDPTKAAHKSGTSGSVELTPSNGRIVISSAESIILESIAVQTKDSTPVTKVKGTDYTAAYNADTKQIILTELSAGTLGSAALTVTYDIIDATAVTNADVIGTTDGMGLNTGLFCLNDVYPLTGCIPAFLAAPGFSSVPEIHAAMAARCQKINGHWDAYMFADLPILSSGNVLTLEGASTFKETNGYNKENETVYFPMAKGIDGKIYHLSVLAAANFQALLSEQDGIPWKTASNTECDVIENLYLGEAYKDRVYDDAIINNKLNKYGICSAAFVGGRWVIWGCHSADYTAANGNEVNVTEINRMMLYYISNDFQMRRSADVDKPMTANDLRTIAAEEQTRLDALVKIGALIYGTVELNASADTRSDIMQGDYSFTFNVTCAPYAKSLTAIVNWTDEGFVTYFESILS